MGIQEDFETITKELKVFTQKTIDFYRGQGQSVDVQSHTDHCHKVFVLGKIQELSDRITKLETKETKNVTGKKTITRKAASRKGNDKSSGQLELGV